ncbi:transcription activator-like protein [Dactylonectria macrodidyma]|uniref:Transcription activator-like protein n=1 Tax=Dactylonectria macrodidyma TaxID=307937 RepID=A0A9P9CWT8_9HYPO|nr:transcription activator-like protein [Dactylonectria macrodidyma]KAH7132680.1 transcription activator-like protein [Dactylonectria macrodidyma]
MGPSSRCPPSRPRHPSRPRDATTARQTATPSTIPPANLRRILRERQSARNRKACLPCRERKVKCNHEQPCQTCVKREHPDLCFYREPGNSKFLNRFQQEPSLHGPSSPETTGESLNNNWVAGNRDARGVDNGSAGAGHSSEGQIPTPSLLGGNSIIALARRDSVQPPTENERRTAFETGIFPLLGMDMNAQEGRSPHSHLAQDGSTNSSLPDDQEMIELFSFYRDRVHPFSFVLDDLDEIEKMVCSLINQDMEGWQCDSPSLCLLHAILAAGAQYSNLALAVQLPKYQNETRFELSRHIRLPEEPFQEADSGSPDSGSCFTERHEPSSSLDPRRHHYSARTIIGSSSA